MIEHVIEKWHEHLRGQLPGGLDELLDDDVVFYSPIVYTPQAGKAITTLYLQAAGQTLPGDQPAAGHDAGGRGRRSSGGSATRSRCSRATPRCSSSRPRSRAST